MIQPNKNKTIKNKLLLFLFSFLICFSFLFAPTQKARAAAWPAIDPLIKSALDVIQGTLKGMIVGAAKKAALMAMEQEINFAITGNSSGGAMFITNWNQTLNMDPQKKANAWINLEISKMTSGRGSISGYIPNNSAGGTLFGANYEGVGDGSLAYGLGSINSAYAVSATGAGSAAGNYITRLAEGAKKLTSNPVEPKVTYQGDPAQMFADPKKGFKNMSLYFSGINNPWDFDMQAQQKYQERLANEKDIAKTQSVAYQGFKGAETDGRITNPGSLIKDAKAGVQNIGGQIIAAAQDIPSVLTAIATQMITQSITQGIGDMQARVHQEISDVRSKSSDAMNSAIGTSGPGALYR